jgi:hypothetical protein
MHIGVGAAIVIVAVIYFMIVSPGFRSFVFVVLLLGVALIGVAIFNNRESNNRSTMTASTNSAPPVVLIPTSDLTIRDTQLKRGYADYWDMSGTVVNNGTERTLSKLAFKVLMRDCPTPETCITIGENRASAYISEGVPPNQARAFSARFEFQHLPQAKKPIWSYELTSAMAR